jgi:hypothetical protein
MNAVFNDASFVVEPGPKERIRGAPYTILILITEKNENVFPE